MKLALGTVQFGMDYGVSNTNGMLDKQSIEFILDKAFSKDIDMIDTAHDYGAAEMNLGMSFAGNSNFSLVTKLPAANSDVIDSERLSFLESSFFESLKKLQMKSVHGLLIHDEADLYAEGGEQIIYLLNKLKDDGYVDNIGISLYSADGVDRCLEFFTPDIVQVPVSIADQRLLMSGHLSKLKSMSVEIHARSIFLQGLLLVSPDLLPDFFDSQRDYFSRLHRFADDRNISVMRLCMDYVSSLGVIDYAVVGVSSVQEFDEVVREYADIAKLAQPDEFLNMGLNDELYVNPVNWKIH